MKTISSTLWQSPLGPILLAATDRGLSGCWFVGQKHFPQNCDQWQTADNLHLNAAMRWLEAFFADANIAPHTGVLDLSQGTEFQQQVWSSLQTIPPGQTLSYGQIAAKLGRPSASRAVGAAVGRNPISLIVPCHRVVGAGRQLTGYAGGLDRKQWLLAHENAA